jgi:hypothetical protein
MKMIDYRRSAADDFNLSIFSGTPHRISIILVELFSATETSACGLSVDCRARDRPACWFGHRISAAPVRELGSANLRSVSTPAGRILLSVSTRAAKVRASLLKARTGLSCCGNPHRP